MSRECTLTCKVIKKKFHQSGYRETINKINKKVKHDYKRNFDF